MHVVLWELANSTSRKISPEASASANITVIGGFRGQRDPLGL